MANVAARGPLREVIGTIIPAADAYGCQKVRLACGHEVWASAKAIYRARCLHCRAQLVATRQPDGGTT